MKTLKTKLITLVFGRSRTAVEKMTTGFTTMYPEEMMSFNNWCIYIRNEAIRRRKL